MGNNDNIFATAYKYHTLGRCVIPSGGGDRHKKALIPWTDYQTKCPSDAQMHEWKNKFHPSVWAMVTGSVSGCFVIDCDTPGAIAMMETVGLKPHIKTPRGGGHYYCHWPPWVIVTKAGILPGIDVRGQGGYANFCGGNGKSTYEILMLPTDESLYWFDQLPPDLQKVLKPGSSIANQQQPAAIRITEGKRNAWLTSLAGSMRRRDMPESAIEAALLEVNATQCDPPLAEVEVSGIARSIARYQPTSELSLLPGQREAASLVCMADVKSETVSWLWPPYIPKGKLTLLEGDPGVGKSWLCLAIATAVSLGRGLPGTETKEPEKVLLASAEDGLGDTVRPRIDSMGANVENIHAIKGTLNFGNGGLVVLVTFIEQVNPSLCIIDPLVAYIGANVDIHRSNETRAIMAQLASIAERYNMTILAVRHLTKGGTAKPIYRGLGSIDITAACRSVLLAGCDPENPQKRGVVQIKSNLAPVGDAIGYELKDGVFYWTGECDLTAEQILATENSKSRSAIDEAVDFLKNELADGPVEASQVWRDAKDTGLSEKTVKRAKAKLGITSDRQGEFGKRGGGKFIWKLPDNHLGNQRALEGQEGHIKEFDPLNNSSLKTDNRTLDVGLLNANPKSLNGKNVLAAQAIDRREVVLGMPVENALEIWRAAGAPVIHLGAGENSFDLARLLSYRNINERQLEAVRKWLLVRQSKDRQYSPGVRQEL